MVYGRNICKEHAGIGYGGCDIFKLIGGKPETHTNYGCFFKDNIKEAWKKSKLKRSNMFNRNEMYNLFSDLNLAQIISEPTHFMRETCKPSCIDLIVTDQPNIVLDSGVRESLDPTVKHQIIFCKDFVWRCNNRFCVTFHENYFLGLT